MVTKLVTPGDKIKLVDQVDGLIDPNGRHLKVSEAMKELGEGGRDRYFEARKWLKENRFIGDDEKWTDKARPFLEILKPLIGASRTSPAPAARSPVELQQVPPAAGQAPAARDLQDARGNTQEARGEEKIKRDYRYEGRGGKARVYVTMGEEVFSWILAKHEQSGLPIAAITSDLVFRGYQAEINK